MSNLSFTFPLKIMARPFRWPLQKQDLLLAIEVQVASRQAIKQSEYEPIASVLSVEFGKLTPGEASVADCPSMQRKDGTPP